MFFRMLLCLSKPWPRASEMSGLWECLRQDVLCCFQCGSLSNAHCSDRQCSIWQIACAVINSEPCRMLHLLPNSKCRTTTRRGGNLVTPATLLSSATQVPQVHNRVQTLSSNLETPMALETSSEVAVSASTWPPNNVKSLRRRPNCTSHFHRSDCNPCPKTPE